MLDPSGLPVHVFSVERRRAGAGWPVSATDRMTALDPGRGTPDGLVQGRRLLRGARARLPRRQRRRRGRLQGPARRSSTTSRSSASPRLWLLPFYPSPLRDDGYDISDYRRVHPSYGTLAGLPRVPARGAPAGPAGHHRAGPGPHLRRAPVVPAGPAGRARVGPSATSTCGATRRTASPRPGSSSPTTRRRTGPSTRSAEAYYWHRFYSHQPEPQLRQPGGASGHVRRRRLLARDGRRRPAAGRRPLPVCPGGHQLREPARDLRVPAASSAAHIDARFEDRMLLAEANQWPEDAVAYMGKGDMCHMAFHFPLMPRMFMAARQEDRFPIVDILAETPTAPARVPVGAVPAQPRRADPRDGHRRGARLHVPGLRRRTPRPGSTWASGAGWPRCSATTAR